MSQPKVGVAITVYNSKEMTKNCLQALGSSNYPELRIVLVDDGSSDGTWDMLQQCFPNVISLQGNGDLWWTGGTNLAVSKCLEIGCEYVLLLNPDVIVEESTISVLVTTANKYSDTIVASVVVSHENPDMIWWAGSEWSPLFSLLPFIWTSRYALKRQTPVNALPTAPYAVSEAHGRAVLVPREVFETIGLYDVEHFPHYGADTDFSFRAREHGFSIVVDPKVQVRLHTERTGLKHPQSLANAWQEYWNYLTRRKNGEALRVWWHLTQRHLQPISAVMSFLFIMVLNALRYWSAAILHGKYEN